MIRALSPLLSVRQMGQHPGTKCPGSMIPHRSEEEEQDSRTVHSRPRSRRPQTGGSTDLERGQVGAGEPPKLQGRARLILLVLPASGATARMRSSSSAKRLPGSISPVAPPPAGTRLVDWENPVWCARSAFPVALQVVPPTESSQTLTNARARCRGNNVGHDCTREASAG